MSVIAVILKTFQSCQTSSGKGREKEEKRKKKKVILAIKKYLNEIQLTFIVFRGNRCLTVAQIMYFMNDAQKHRELCKMEKHLFLST